MKPRARQRYRLGAGSAPGGHNGAAIPFGEVGFTLIELMVALLVVAILMAIAIPTFLGTRKTAGDRAAQSDLRSAVSDALVYYYNNNASFDTSSNLASALGTAAPTFTFSTSGVLAARAFSVYVTADHKIAILEDYAPVTNRCWLVEVNEESQAVNGGDVGASTNRGLSYGAWNNTSNCNAAYTGRPEFGWSMSFPTP